MSRQGIARRVVVTAALLLLACAPLSARAEGDTDAAATRAARDETDPCTDVDVFAIFPKHLNGAETHARFDLRALNASALGPGGGNLGYIEGSSSTEYDTKVTATFCLPRGHGFFLIASGNATRGSAFGRFTVSVTSREYYNMTLFSAGSDWTRGAAYDSDEPTQALADGELREFLEDRGVGPPLWDTFDASHTYELHGRARFDTWGRNPAAIRRIASTAHELEEAEAFYADCGALVAVFVGCPSYGNGAKPGDMSWAVVPRGETVTTNALASVRGDAFHWGASVAHVVCLPAGDYDVLAFDAGSAGRGWGVGATLDVLQLEESDGEYFHGFALNADSGNPAWFTRGKTARLEISPTGRTKAPIVRAAEASAEFGAAVGGVRRVARVGVAKPDEGAPRRALLESAAATGAFPRHGTFGDARNARGETGFVTRVATATATVALVVAAAAAATAAAPDEDPAAPLKLKPGRGSAAARARLVRARARGAAYGADEGSGDAYLTPETEVPIVTAREGRVSPLGAARVSKAALAIAAAAGVVAAAGMRPGGDGASLAFASASSFASRAGSGSGSRSARASLGAARGARARLGTHSEVASMCGMGIPGCSILEPPACEGRAYAYKPGMLAHLQGGAGSATVLAASAEWAGDLRDAVDPARAHSLVDVNHGLCDVVERIEGTSGVNWSGPESHGLNVTSSLGGVVEAARGERRSARASRRPVARLGDASSGCVNDLGGFENATLQGCREACRRADGCVSYRAFRLVRFDETDIVFDSNRNQDAHADYSCRICGAGGAGAFVPDFEAEATIDSVRGPAWCLTEHRLAFAADAVEECAAACDATPACDAFNFGNDHGDCMLLRLGANATAGAVWRGSAGRHAGIAGYATYYAVSPTAVEAAVAASDAVAAADAAAQTVLAPSRAERACRADAARGGDGGRATGAVTYAKDFVAGKLDEEAGVVADASSLTESSEATETTATVRVLFMDTAGSAARRPAAPPALAADTDASADSATATTSSASPTPTPAADSSSGSSASTEASPTPAATPAVEKSGATDIVDAAQDMEDARDEPVSASDDESGPASGDDGVAAPEETAEHAVAASVRRAARVVRDGATKAAEATEDAVEKVVHAVSSGATKAGDAMADGFNDSSVAAVNAVDGAMAAVDGAVDRLTHENESDDWVENELFDGADAEDAEDAEDANAAPDHPASKPAATRRMPPAAESGPAAATTRATPSSSSSSSSPSSSADELPDERVIPFDSDAFEPSFQEPAEEADAKADPEAAAEARRRAEAVYDDEGAFVPDSASESDALPGAPPPAPIYIPEVMPTLLETCDTCATPPCRPFEEDVRETEFILHAESCCQATGWQYGNSGAFPHTCGECAEGGRTMTYARALTHCFETGGGLCANNQVTAGSRTPSCATEEGAEVWTSEACGASDEGRFVMLAGGGGRRCELELSKKFSVVCCANTCNTYLPDHMCPAESAREFWQASAEASAGAAASAAMGAARRRDPNVRVALPELPRVKASRAQHQSAQRTEGAPFRAAALGSPEDKEAVLRAARDAMAATR